MKHRNVYMGPKSTAKLPVIGSVDADWEILSNAFATGYDALNPILLTRKEGHFDKTNKAEVNGRFAILYRVCQQHHPRICNAVKEMQRVVNDHIDKKLSDFQALQFLREICFRYGLDASSIEIAMMQINAAENLRPVHHKKQTVRSMMPGGDIERFINRFHENLETPGFERNEHKKRKRQIDPIGNILGSMVIGEMRNPFVRRRRL